jgi:glycosyltransferase involved in cell wall biosynthesis
VSDFSPEAFISNSPIDKISYRRTRRLRFLFAALRTRSIAARELLARIATNDAHGFNELIVIDLAWLCNNQPADENHLSLALTIYRWVIKNDPSRFRNMHRQDLAMLALLANDSELRTFASKKLPWFWPVRFLPKILKTKYALGAAELLNSGFVFGQDYSIPPSLLRLDLENPFRESREDDKWLAKFSKGLFPKGAAAVSLDEGDSVFDSLSARPSKQITTETLVTVVVSCYKPNQELITSIKSILASNYQNLEVLVYDDGSGPGFDQLFEKVRQLDFRIRVKKMDKNGGTYAIRNRALDEAQGDLITFHDSDDWMHPERIARQAKRLISGKRLGNISMSTRVDNNLGMVESGRRLRIGLCEPSLMFWRKKVMNKVGYFDLVRKGADSEYRKRIQKAFDVELEVIHPYKALTLQRADHGGLTDGDLTFRWIVDYRLAYRDSYNRWHKTATSLKLPNSPKRAFFAPRQMRFTKKLASNERKVDLVIAANFCDPKQEKMLQEEIQKALDKKLFIGLHQISTMFPLALPRSIRGSFLEALHKGHAHLVYPEDNLEVSRLRIFSPSAYLVNFQDRQYNWMVRGKQVEPLDANLETWNAEGEGLLDLLYNRMERNFGKLGN